MGMRLPVLLVCAALLAGCDVQVGKDGEVSVNVAEGRASDEWVRSYAVQPGATLEIVNVNGRIEATGTSGTQLEVRAERIVREHTTETAEQRLREVKMLEEVSASRIRIEAAAPRDQGLLGHRSSLNVSYRVSVPAGVAVKLETENGEIQLDNLNGAVTVSTTNGRVNGTALSGPLSLESINGGVQLDFAAVGGDIRVSTTNGSIRLGLPAGVKAALDASCVNGEISVDDELMLQASENSRRRLAGTFNGGGARIAASTVNGGIRIRTRETRPE